MADSVSAVEANDDVTVTSSPVTSSLADAAADDAENNNVTDVSVSKL